MNRHWHIYIGIAVGLFALFGVFTVRPFIEHSKKVHAGILEAQSQLDDFERMLQELPSWLKARDELNLKREQLNSRLYAKQGILDLFDALSKNASRNQLAVMEVTPPISELLQLNNTIQTSDQPLFLNITISLDGEYVNFGQFVKNIENAPYFSGINNCMIIGGEHLTDPLNFTVGFKALLGHPGEES